jgi:hypothetical protein
MGCFQNHYVNAIDEELIKEAKEFLPNFLKLPSTYNGDQFIIQNTISDFNSIEKL